MLEPYNFSLVIVQRVGGTTCAGGGSREGRDLDRSEVITNVQPV